MDPEYIEAKHRFSREVNELVQNNNDFLQNHTLEDEFTKVQICIKQSSPTFGTVLSIQKKFQNPDKSEQPLFSSNLMNLGSKLLWTANVTLMNATDGSQRLVKFQNDFSNIKSKSVDLSNANSQSV